MIEEMQLVLEVIRACPAHELDALGKRIAKSIENDKWDEASINRARQEWLERKRLANLVK
jgi:hypothetical protein